MVRPSFVLGGRGMEVIYDEENLKRYGVEAIQVSPEYPMLIDRFLDNAIEAEVDALADGTDTFVATVMEHIELAGIHSGDSACAIPPVTIAPKHIRTIEEHAAKIAQDFQVKGILNVQFAICNDEVYIIEANPRASRTVPIVSKVTGISLARYATEIMLGKKLKELGLKSRACRFIGVKEAVFPFNMFPEVDPVLGPEMRATGEVMGIADNFGMAYYKAQEAAVALNIRQPESGTARSLEEAVELGRRIGYPVMVRPSFVLGGRGMEVIYDEENLKRYGVEAIQVSPEYPMLIDRFLDNAIEAEVDALADGTDTFVATVMEHIELAGIHSGDSACAIPPVTIAPKHIRTIEEHAAKIAQDFQVKGILNVQFAICNDEVYIIEANPRASRTVPIVSKVTGISLARYATEIMLGKKLKELGLKSRACRFIGVKEAVFPFNMFPEVDPVLGPEMRATGEVMGIADNFGMAYYKAQEAAGCILPTAGKVLVTVSDRDKKFIEPIARDLISLGFTIVSTGGTAEYLRGQGVETEVVNKLHEGRPNLGDMITNKQIDLIINTPVDRTSMIDDSFIRMQSIQKKIPYMTTIAAARATVEGIRSAQHVKVSPRSLQEYHS